MLHLTIQPGELWDEEKQMFVSTKKEQKLTLEHSLVSLSKWESKWCKPFLTNEVKTTEETIDYIRCMTITQNVDPNVYSFITDEQLTQINQYIDNPMTATWFSKQEDKGKHNGEQITSELVYYWMIALQIPFKCEKWHFNRLITLIRVCDIKNQPAKKMSRRETMSRNAALNAARKKRLHTKG